MVVETHKKRAGKEHVSQSDSSLIPQAAPCKSSQNGIEQHKAKPTASKQQWQLVIRKKQESNIREEAKQVTNQVTSISNSYNLLTENVCDDRAVNMTVDVENAAQNGSSGSTSKLENMEGPKDTQEQKNEMDSSDSTISELQGTNTPDLQQQVTEVTELKELPAASTFDHVASVNNSYIESNEGFVQNNADMIEKVDNTVRLRVYDAADLECSVVTNRLCELVKIDNNEKLVQKDEDSQTTIDSKADIRSDFAEGSQAIVEVINSGHDKNSEQVGSKCPGADMAGQSEQAAMAGLSEPADMDSNSEQQKPVNAASKKDRGTTQGAQALVEVLHTNAILEKLNRLEMQTTQNIGDATTQGNNIKSTTTKERTKAQLVPYIELTISAVKAAEPEGIAGKFGKEAATADHVLKSDMSKATAKDESSVSPASNDAELQLACVTNITDAEINVTNSKGQIAPAVPFSHTTVAQVEDDRVGQVINSSILSENKSDEINTLNEDPSTQEWQVIGKRNNKATRVVTRSQTKNANSSWAEKVEDEQVVDQSPISTKVQEGNKATQDYQALMKERTRLTNKMDKLFVRLSNNNMRDGIKRQISAELRALKAEYSLLL